MATDLDIRFGLDGLAERLNTAAARAADPERALRVAESVLAATTTADPGFAATWARAPAAVVRILCRLGGAAPFFAPFLTRHPDWLRRLAEEDLAAARTPAAYRDALAAATAGIPGAREGDALRRFKYYELARITVRDLSPELVPEEHAGETLAELSHLADALLDRALATAMARIEASCGPPEWAGPAGTPMRLRFCVLGLGKLGSEELNYSSDVDLVYVYEIEPGVETSALTGGPQGLSPAEYFTRVGHEFGHLVGEPTPEGFLYRIDLDLRPEGAGGPLVVSSDILARYYELWAATWEKAAFMKARPVAGDAAFGWSAIRAIDPLIYRSAMDFASVAAIRKMKEKILQAAGRTADAFNLKIGSGGIRDIEFVAQALQLLHGGRIPDVRGRSTQETLIALQQVGVLPDQEAADLLAAYRFLRRTENRLQMESERQIHTLPAAPADLTRLARAMGFLQEGAAAAFAGALESHRHRVSEIFRSLFRQGGSDPILALFARNVPNLMSHNTSRAMIEHLADHFAREIDASADAERAMNNLDRFLRGVGGRRFYYELLLDRPELVPRLAALFAASEYLSGYFATHPRLIEPIFSDPTVLILSRPELNVALARIRDDLAREGGRDDVESDLDALRLFHNRELINVGLLDLAGKVAPAEAEDALTDIAEVCVQHGLAIAQAELERQSAQPREAAAGGEFLVVGMGKLASREITYGSDLDVIFLYDVPGGDAADLPEAQAHFVRLAQKLIWALRTRTSDGVCYEIDARLRPSGNQGMLVSSLAAFERYHATSAQVWERQALLRARPVAGSPRLGEKFTALRAEILRRQLAPDAGREIHRIRLRVETELAQESTSRHDFKTGRGGLIDVESVVQFLQLRHGREHPDLLAVEPVTTQLDRLEGLGLLSSADAAALREGWEFLQLLSSRLRIVENRSISDLDEERGDLDALGHRLGYTGARAGGARRALLDDYRRRTSAIREVYLRVLGV